VISPATFPILDTARLPNPGTGGDTAFRASSTSTAVSPPPSNGASFDVAALDAPQCACDNYFPSTMNAATSTDGSLYFIDFLSCYSSDFNESYMVLGSATWSARFNFNNSDDSWSSASSSVTGPSSLTTIGFPDSALDAGVVTTGPYTFWNSRNMVYY
jgi:hypothetical protein